MQVTASDAAFSKMPDTNQQSPRALFTEDEFDSLHIARLRGSQNDYSIEIFLFGSWHTFIAKQAKTSELLSFAKFLQEIFDANNKPLTSIRFVHNNRLITLCESHTSVWALATKEDLLLFLNKDKFLFDFNNEKNRLGNSAFKSSQFADAVPLYSLSMKRYPDHMKPLCNRALVCCLAKKN